MVALLGENGGESFVGDAVVYERKALGNVNISSWGSGGQPRVGSSTGDFERCFKGALDVEDHSLWEFCLEKLEGGLPC